MGNCQAAEAATVIIQHPAEKKVERIYFSVTARHVMNSNPGHFVALLLPPPENATSSKGGVTVKHLKLLRPDDVLLLGQVYRLVPVQDVLKEFAAKKCVKLAKLLERGGIVIDKNKFNIYSSLVTNHKHSSLEKVEQQHVHRTGSSSSCSDQRGRGKKNHGGRQWKPALQSISEFGI